jgi:hypothetical protein
MSAGRIVTDADGRRFEVTSRGWRPLDSEISASDPVESFPRVIPSLAEGPTGNGQASVPPTDLYRILDDLEEYCGRYLVLTLDQLAALVLWIALTWVYEAFEVSPYLLFRSPERRSGKTRALEVLRAVVRNPLASANLSPAVLFRSIAEGPTTVLLDEVDAVFNRREGNEDLRGLLNAGFQRGGQVQRCETVGRTQVVKTFDVYSPKALAMIGVPPETIGDRAVHLSMRRKAPGEIVQRFRWRLVRGEAEPIRAALAAWAEVARPQLEGTWPELPDALDDRGQDAWEGLLAIADLAGSEWASRARLAAVTLAADKDDGSESLGVLLLEHVREAFGDHDRISTADLLTALIAEESGPWPAWWATDVEQGRTKGPAARLARLLKPYGGRPEKYRVGETTVRGYLRADFEDAFRRYGSPLRPEQRNDGTGNTHRASDLHVPLFRPAGTEGQGGHRL